MSRRGFCISAAIALAIVVSMAAMRGGIDAVDPATGYRAWSDAFFAAGVFVGGAGLIGIASSDGLFDAIRFGVGRAVRVVLSKERRDAYPRTFHDYRLMRRGRGMSGLSAALTGLVCIALAGLFLALYLRA